MPELIYEQTHSYYVADSPLNA